MYMKFILITSTPMPRLQVDLQRFTFGKAMYFESIVDILSPENKTIEDFLAKGEVVPSEVIAELIIENLKGSSSDLKILLGYPKTKEQLDDLICSLNQWTGRELTVHTVENDSLSSLTKMTPNDESDGVIDVFLLNSSDTKFIFKVINNVGNVQ